MLNLVLIFGITCLGCPSIQSLSPSCDDENICQGEGPLQERACCTGLGGAECTPGPKGQNGCNTKLGYKCQEREKGIGTCTGAYGLSVTNITFMSITLTWDDFQPAGYQYEYSILYSSVYSSNVSSWSREEHGEGPTTTVYGLDQSTVYFFRVATWKQLEVLANLTEVVVISTTAMPFCEYNNKKYMVGQELQIDCEDVCVCMSNGELECRPVCNDTSVLLPAAPNLVCHEEMRGCCPTTFCVEKPSLTSGDIMTGATSGAGDDHSSGTPDLTFGSCEGKVSGSATPMSCKAYTEIQTWHRDCQTVCNCTGDHLACYPLCGAAQAPVPGTDCRLLNQPYLCCQQWVCQPSDDAHTVTLNVTLVMTGTCNDSDHALLSLLSEAGASTMYYYSLRACSLPEVGGASCTIDKTYIQCPNHKTSGRSGIHIMLSIAFHVRRANSQRTLRDMVSMLYATTKNMSAALSDGNTSFPVTSVHISQPAYTCSNGFSWNGFKCANTSSSTSRVFQVYEVLERSAILNWSLSGYDEDITRIVVCWRQLDKNTQVSQIPVNKTITKVQIIDLDPSTMYTAWLDVLVQNITWVHFQELHFLTHTASLVDTRTYERYLVGIIVAMVTLTVAMLVGGSCILLRKHWHRRKKRVPLENAFENKIFEIRVREDGIY